MQGPAFVLVLLLLTGGGAWLVDAAGAKYEVALAASNERLRAKVMKVRERQRELTGQAQQSIQALRVEEGEPCAKDCLLRF